MKCPSCEKTTKNRARCDHCKADLLLYKKVHMMAASLYNKGLEQAQGRCLSGAISTLTMCLGLQKDHLEARNLLGLIYWEVGEVTQALKHWQISAQAQKEDNLATSYLARVQEDPLELATYTDTMGLFNKSLQHMAQGSEDMAIISLRKAMAQNPNYIKAKALLSLYYITQKQEDKGAQLLKEILEISKDDPKANHYWNELDPTTVVKAQEVVEEVPVPKPPRVKPARVKAADTMIQPKSLKGTIMAFALGAVCMLGVYMILITPSKTGDLKNQIKIAQAKEVELANELEAFKNKQAQTIKALEEKQTDLLEENESLKSEQSAQQIALDLQAVAQLASDRQWPQAASKLGGIKQEFLTEETRTKYDELVLSVYPKAGEELYNQGYRQYQAKDYAQALELLEASYGYAKEEWFSSNALFITGRAYEDQGDIQKAKDYYQSVIDNYPGTKSATNAKRRL